MLDEKLTKSCYNLNKLKIVRIRILQWSALMFFTPEKWTLTESTIGVSLGDNLKLKLLKLEERVKEERKKRALVMLKKPKTILELILFALKHGGAEDDFIDGIEVKTIEFFLIFTSRRHRGRECFANMSGKMFLGFLTFGKHGLETIFSALSTFKKHS